MKIFNLNVRMFLVNHFKCLSYFVDNFPKCWILQNSNFTILLDKRRNTLRIWKCWQNLIWCRNWLSVSLKSNLSIYQTDWLIVCQKQTFIIRIWRHIAPCCKPRNFILKNRLNRKRKNKSKMLITSLIDVPNIDYPWLWLL